MPGDGDTWIEPVDRPTQPIAGDARTVLDVEVEARPILNFAMAENAIPLIERIAITHHGAEPTGTLEVRVRMDPAVAKPWSAQVASLVPGSTARLVDVDLELDRDRLVNTVEGERGTVTVEVHGAGGRLHHSVHPVDILAYNEWHARSLPQLLSAFVLPNHPVIGQILRHARGALERRTGSPAFDGYQSHEPARALAMTEAIYETVQALDITYVNPPASFESSGQKIRTPEQVLGQRMGTCLDLTVFVAACLEQAGLSPILFVIAGHALPGVWLADQDLADGATDDPAWFRKLEALGATMSFDSSTVAMRPRIPFAEARRSAEAMLAEDDTFRFAVDVKGCRRLKFRPLPARASTAFFSVIDSEPESDGEGDSEAARLVADILTRAKEAPASADAEAPPPSPSPIPRIESWKQKLLDLSLRNKLVAFKPTRSAIKLLCPDIAAFEDLVAGGESLAIAGVPMMLSDADPRNLAQLARKHGGDDAVRQYLAEVLQKGLVHTALSDSEVSVHLKEIARQARESLEETGANTLCFAIGMLRWFESESSEVERLAPLILVPARIEKRGNGYCVASAGDDTRINVTLLEKLHNDFGITIPELHELPEDDAGVDVPRILRAFRKAVIHLSRWDIVEEVALAHFSFTKFVMWRDLRDKTESLLENELVRHLALGAREVFPDQGDFARAEDLDDAFSPGDLVCPLDADSTQLAAVAAGVSGKSFVLQGPPGTGKSQTITNLIAAAMAAGQRVLFVAEKRAALEVVHHRLTGAGLGDFCLELHSNKTQKREVVSELARTYTQVERTTEPATFSEDSARLMADRDTLNRYARALAGQRDGGLSAFSALSSLIGLRAVPHVAVSADVLDENVRSACREAIHNLTRTAADVMPIASHPWRAMRPPLPGVTGRDKVAEAIAELVDAATAVDRALTETGARALPVVPSCESAIGAWAEAMTLVAQKARAPEALLSVPDWPAARSQSRALVALGSDVTARRLALLERYREPVFQLDLEALVARFRRWSGAFFLIAWWMLRSAKAALRRVSKQAKLAPAAELTEDLDCALEVSAKTAELSAKADAGGQLFGSQWPPPDGDWETLGAAIEWADRFRAVMDHLDAPSSPAQRQALITLARDGHPGAGRMTAAFARYERAKAALCDLVVCAPEALCGAPEAPDVLARLTTRLDHLRDHLGALASWAHYVADEAAVHKLGLSALTDALRSGALVPAQLGDVFERSFLLRWLERTLAADPILAGFSGATHNGVIERFSATDTELMTLVREVARARISARFPRKSEHAAGEVGVLLREAKKKRRHMPIRRLFERIPAVLERLKPCMLMSPLSVAQYLDPNASPFDLVIFDEASQIPTHDAIGALARGRKALVVGDDKQLPPTRFFHRAGGDDDDAPPGDDDPIVELESILDECVASRVPQLTLGWHYRSRHESLIAFSNHHYYDNRLHTFPSPVTATAHLGVSLRAIDGHYDRGKSGTNRAEAMAVAGEVTARLLDPARRGRSIGIVTFNRAQQRLIEDLLDEQRHAHPEIEDFFSGEGAREPVIVKNLENIQGDERDVILFSITYGPDALGRVRMNFGPLNQDGGERRLNVAITRAREQLIVFSTLRPDQIDLTRTSARGVGDLKTFLDYARRGPRAIAEATAASGALDFDSPFEKAVRNALVERGWIVHTQIGCAGYRIDLGVAHPKERGRFVLGIECDGASYHSAKSARDRDRLRAQVLRGLGWKLHRIWSSDWWAQPEREIARAEDAIRAAIADSDSAPGISAPGISAPGDSAPVADGESASHSETAPPPVAESAPPVRANSPPAIPSAPVHPIYAPAVIEDGQHPADDFFDVHHTAEVMAVIRRVIDGEAPIVPQLLCRRICPHWGISKVTRRVEKRLHAVLASSPGDSAPVEFGGALWSPGQDPAACGFRVAGDDPASRRDAQDLPVDEVASAARFILQGAVAIARADLERETAHLFGYARIGRRVAQAMAAGVDRLLESGRAVAAGYTLRLPS